MDDAARYDAGKERAWPGAFYRFASAYWLGDKRRIAWLLTIGIAGIMAVTLLVNLGLNYWNRWFFDALEKRDGARLWSVLLWLPLLIGAGAALAVLMVRLRMALQVRWRADVTSRMLRLWLGDQRYYRLALADRKLDNVEYRIAEDVRLSTEPAVDLAVGFLWSLTSALTFIGVLFTVGGSISVGGVSIPGYLAISAVLYAAIVGAVTIYIGQPLAGLVAAKNETEAQFRYELTRVRENAESIALMHGDAREQSQTTGRLDGIVAAWLDVIRQHGRLTFVLNSNSFLAPIVPALLATPKYLSGEMTLGSVMQLIAAFGSVLGALNWFADNYIRLSELAASARRAEELRSGLAALDPEAGLAQPPAIEVGASADKAIELQNVTLRKGDGEALVKRANIKILAGQKVLIEGKSGSGKSTLLRALAGLWPWGAGSIKLPKGAKVAFVPQRPYIPLGKLRDALIYPAPASSISEERSNAIFEEIGLGHLRPRLDDVDTWDRILSGGERQRLAFGRLLVMRPDIVVLDEATSALDDDGQSAMFTLLARELPEATILNVAHRKGLEAFHDRKLTIDPSASAPRLSLKAIVAPGSRLIGTLRRRRMLKLAAGEARGQAPPDDARP
jgi:putative ATP-binding cassette transporter